jgi:hypothetical protein
VSIDYQENLITRPNRRTTIEKEYMYIGKDFEQEKKRKKGALEIFTLGKFFPQG